MRFNAALGLTWGLSATLASIIVSVFFDDHLGNWWPISVGALALASSLLMLNLRHHLNDREDGPASVSAARRRGAPDAPGHPL